jgi:peptidoglycan/xylan/chitin deacetylase (PgdA/CDA1 family)
LNKYFLIQPSKLIKKFYSKALWQINTSEKEIYLTFDDGPIVGLTEWILDELKKYSAKATFFCVGENIIKNKNIFDRIVHEGHQIGNHTQNHIKGFNSNLEDYLNNVESCEKLTGSKLFRPPYGQLRKSQYKTLLSKNYKIVFWDVISYDYEKINKNACFLNVKKNTKNGSIVLFHDNLKAEENVKYALNETLKYFSEAGYVFKAINV